jgi:DNA-binding MarR family transcriptional regulator
MDFEPSEAEQLWFAVLGAREVVFSAMDSALVAKHDLSVAAFVVLLGLRKHGELSMNELAPLVPIVSRSQVSRLVDALADRGLVERSVRTDARVRVVGLTKGGLKTVESARLTASNAAMHVLEPVSPKTLASVRELWRLVSPLEPQ